MDYLTRQLLLELTKLHETYQKQSRTADSIQKANHENQEIQNKSLKELLSAYKESEGNKTKSDDRQYKVQNSIRYATWVASIGAVLAFGTGCVYAWINYHQWQTAKDALIATNRPWVDLTPSITGPLTVDAQGGHLPITLSAKNVGHSPAVRVSDSQGFIQTILNSDPEPWKELRKVCAQAVGQSAQPFNRGVTATIFVDGKHDFPMILTLSPSELSKSLRDLFPDAKDNSTGMELRVVWCVGYRGDFETTTHQTGYIWRLVMKNNHGTNELIPRDTKMVPKENLVLLDSFFGPLAD